MTAESAFGTYRAEYAQEGCTLRVVRRIGGGRGTQPPEKAAELLAWLKELSKDDAKFIVIEPAAGN